MRYATLANDWTRILAQAEISEPPGREQVLEDIQQRPYKAPVKKPKKR